MAVLGARLDPNNPLYQATPISAGSQLPTDDAMKAELHSDLAEGQTVSMTNSDLQQLEADLLMPSSGDVKTDFSNTKSSETDVLEFETMSINQDLGSDTLENAATDLSISAMPEAFSATEFFKNELKNDVESPASLDIATEAFSDNKITAVEEINFDLPAIEMPSDISFDVTETSADTMFELPDEIMTDTSLSAANTFDFSDLSLDLTQVTT